MHCPVGIRPLLNSAIIALLFMRWCDVDRFKGSKLLSALLNFAQDGGHVGLMLCNFLRC